MNDLGALILFIMMSGCIVLLLEQIWKLRSARDACQIRMEEAQAWADEYERERDALASECDRLREKLAALQGLYVRRTRESLAANFWIIASNGERKRPLGHDG